MSSGKSTDHGQRAKVMVSIITPSGVPEQRAPVDIVLVLHVQIRLIAPPNWHHLLVKATQVVLDKLGEHDRLAIVPASLMEKRAVKPEFYEMSSLNKKRAIAAVNDSQAMRRNAQLLTDLESAESVCCYNCTNEYTYTCHAFPFGQTKHPSKLMKSHIGLELD